jgi:hypothetical protein
MSLCSIIRWKSGENRGSPHVKDLDCSNLGVPGGLGWVEFREENSETKSACIGKGITSDHSVPGHRKPNIQG